MKTIWHIELLGELKVLRNGRACPVGNGRPAALLAYLALHPGEHSRNLVAERLWPESTGDRRAALRTALKELRQRLADTGREAGANAAELENQPEAERLLQDVGGTLSLCREGMTTDLHLYRDALRQAEKAARTSAHRESLQKAVDLYDGKLLPRLDDAWVVYDRARLAEEQRKALEQLLELQEQAGEYAAAIVSAQRMAELDALDDQAHAHVLRLYLLAGQTAAAQEYCRKVQRKYEAENAAWPATLEQWAETARTRRRDVNRLDALSRAQLRDAYAPACPTPFFGREQELERLRTRLSREETRLVTLTGPGGTGKTRLALETARLLQDIFPRRVYYLELADIQDAGRIVEEVARMVLPSRNAKLSPLASLAQQTGSVRLLLMLDNFEHLIEMGAKIVETLLARCPAWTILVTSRLPLNVEGESPFPVLMLSPESSLDLFVYHAQIAQPNFTLNETNEKIVSALCAQLECYPLAIELAAAWTGTVPLPEMRDFFKQRFAVLARSRQRQAGRQDSLRVVIAWSYEQLSLELRKFFAASSTFRGGWNVKAAQAIWEGISRNEGKVKTGAAEDVWQMLRTLRTTNLIHGQEINGDIRFHMLETLREFAQEQLTDEERPNLSDCHAAYFLNLAETAEPYLNGQNAIQWLDTLDNERENLNTALDWLYEQQQKRQSLRFAHALVRFWRIRGHGIEGRQYLSRALALYTEPTLLRANALRHAGGMANDQDDLTTSTHLYTESLALARQLQDHHCIAWGLYSLGHNHLSQGDYEKGREYLEECLALAERSKELRCQASTLHKIGGLLFTQGVYAEAGSYFERSAALFHELGDQLNEAVSLLNLGNVLNNQGRIGLAKIKYEVCLNAFKQLKNDSLYAVVQICLGSLAHRNSDNGEAQQLLEHAMKTLRRSGARVHEAWARYFLGNLAWHQGNYKQAREHYTNSLIMLQECGDQRREAQLLLAFGWLAQAEHNPERAARLFGAGNAWYARLGAMIVLTERYEYDPALAALRVTLDESTFAACWAEGQAYTPEQAIAYALQDNIDQS